MQQLAAIEAVPDTALTQDASVFQATPEQANQFIIWVVFVLVNVIGAGLTLALLFWFGNREVKVVSQMPDRPSDAEQLPAE